MVRARRYELPGSVRFLTWSCFGRLPLLGNAKVRDGFAEHLTAVKADLGFDLYAWVVMPEHVHLFLRPATCTVAHVLRRLKGPFARRVIERWRDLDASILERVTTDHGETRFWQRGGGYDRNMRSRDDVVEKIKYIDENPVRRGLCRRPEGWAWSSARWYAGDREDQIPMDPIPW